MLTLGPRPAHLSLILDTNVVNDWRFRKPVVLKRLGEYLSIVKSPPALASVTVFELLHGFEKTSVKEGGLDEPSKRGMEQVRKLIASCTVLPFDQPAAEIAAYIFPRLSRSERAEHWADVLIGSTALTNNCGVVTHNTTDFALIAKYTPPASHGLKFEVWK